MRSVLSVFASVILALPLLLDASAAGDRGGNKDGKDFDCDAARCAAQAEIDALCPCDSARNHGQYVRCVVAVARALVPNQCRGRVTSCAARTGCGRKNPSPCELDGTCCASCSTTTTSSTTTIPTTTTTSTTTSPTTTTTTTTTLYGSPSRAFLAPVPGLLD